jgi:trimethylamine:corrinoid methyltransferase-like protein
MSCEQDIRPLITVLDEHNIGQIHESSLHILKSVGLEIDSEKAVEVFSRAGADVDGSRVRISSASAKAPKPALASG